MKYTAIVSWFILGKRGNYLQRSKTIRNVIAEDIQTAADIALQRIPGVNAEINCIWYDWPQT